MSPLEDINAIYDGVFDFLKEKVELIPLNLTINKRSFAFKSLYNSDTYMGLVLDFDEGCITCISVNMKANNMVNKIISLADPELFNKIDEMIGVLE